MLHSVDSEVGRLRTVLLHRPGAELLRLTPEDPGARLGAAGAGLWRRQALLFDGLPWVARAQEEHDSFAARLRDNGVEVLYLADLLREVLAGEAARQALVQVLVDDPRLGAELGARLAGYLSYLDGESLATVLIAGLARGELRTGSGLVHAMLGPTDFVVDPLPGALFARDCAVWIGDQVAVTSLSAPRRREGFLAETVYRWHPRFLGSPLVYNPGREPLCGGDVLHLGAGVLAVGVGRSTTAAGAEWLSRAVLGAGLAHTVLVVPLPGPAPLDTLCTVVDVGTVLMRPDAVEQLGAYQLSAGEDGEPEVRAPRPFTIVAAQALGLEQLRIIDTGLAPVTGHGQWDDGANTFALAPGLCVAYERNGETNAALERAGVQVIAVPGSELRSRRGGPRALCCPIARDAVTAPAPTGAGGAAG